MYDYSYPDEVILNVKGDEPGLSLTRRNEVVGFIINDDFESLRAAVAEEPRLLGRWRDDGMTLFHEAVRLCNDEMVMELFKLNNQALDIPNNRGTTPMHSATRRDEVMIRILYLLGSKVVDTPRWNGLTPMHYAALCDDWDFSGVELHALGSESHFVIGCKTEVPARIEKKIGALYFSRSLLEVLFFVDETWQHRVTTSKKRMATLEE